jgi:hypothetical protein
VSLSSRLRRPLAAVVLGAALLAPVQLGATALADTSTTHRVAGGKQTARATQATLTAYGDTDSAGAVHLSGSVRWADGKVLGRQQHVQLWARSGTHWVLVQQAVTDRSGDVELSVVPVARTTYELHYAGSHSKSLRAVAGPSRSPRVEVLAVTHVRLDAPTRVHRGQTFVITGKVTPAGAGRVITLSGNGTRFTTLRTRADGSFSGRVRLQMKTTLRVGVAGSASLSGAASDPHVVRVA